MPSNTRWRDLPRVRPCSKTAWRDWQLVWRLRFAACFGTCSKRTSSIAHPPQPQQEAVEVVSPDLLDHVEYATMLYNRKVLKALEWCTQERLAMLDDAAVLEIARAASEWSCMNHPGVFASRVLESALRDVGRRQLSGGPPWRVGGSRRRVLHVLTVAHPIGGHTRRGALGAI